MVRYLTTNVKSNGYRIPRPFALRYRRAKGVDFLVLGQPPIRLFQRGNLIEHLSFKCSPLDAYEAIALAIFAAGPTAADCILPLRFQGLNGRLKGRCAGGFNPSLP
jgi:hypothetical protein